MIVAIFYNLKENLLKRVLVVDWLDKFGGAERVIAKLEQVFGFGKIYALTNVMKLSDLNKIANGRKIEIETTFLQVFGNVFRMLFFTFHYFITKIKIEKTAQTIISSSHAVAKGVLKSHEEQLHISYFQARNFKYIWDDAPLYFGKLLFLVKPLINYLQKVDFKQAQKPDYIISNSKFVQQWVKEKYKRDSVVIYPPVALDDFPLECEKEDYYVAVGRIVAYKRFDLIVKAFKNSNKKLIVLGDGAELEKLKSIATSNIQFTGFVDSSTVQRYISKAKAFIHIGVEDFGIAPIEAQSCGTPVIAFKAGGILETVLDGKTGLFFEKQTEDSLLTAIESFELKKWDPIQIHKHAQSFSENRFVDEINAYVSNCENVFFFQT